MDRVLGGGGRGGVASLRRSPHLEVQRPGRIATILGCPIRLQPAEVMGGLSIVVIIITGRYWTGPPPTPTDVAEAAGSPSSSKELVFQLVARHWAWFW